MLSCKGRSNSGCSKQRLIGNWRSAAATHTNMSVSVCCVLKVVCVAFIDCPGFKQVLSGCSTAVVAGPHAMCAVTGTAVIRLWDDAVFQQPWGAVQD